MDPSHSERIGVGGSKLASKHPSHNNTHTAYVVKAYPQIQGLLPRLSTIDCEFTQPAHEVQGENWKKVKKITLKENRHRQPAVEIGLARNRIPGDKQTQAQASWKIGITGVIFVIGYLFAKMNLMVLSLKVLAWQILARTLYRFRTFLKGWALFRHYRALSHEDERYVVHKQGHQSSNKIP